MLKKINVIGLGLMLSMLCSASAFAGYSLVVTAPTVQGSDSTSNALATAINTAMSQASVIGPITDSLNSDHFSKVGNLEDMSRGFANSAAVASYAGTNQSFQNYDLVSIMGGFMLGASLPKGWDAADQIDKKGDAYVGITPAFALNVGLKVPFVADSLYINGKIGYGGIKSTVSDIDIDSSQYLFGVGLNYALIKDWTLFPGLLKWRGFSLGAGLTYLNSKNEITVPFDGTYRATATGGYSFTVDDVKGKFSVKAKSFSVPVDVVTSLQVLILNVGLGAGVDINLPSSTITAGGSANVNVDSSTLPSGVTQKTAGNIAIKQTTDSSAKFTDIVNPKIMASAGLNLAIVKLDIPMIYYPVSNTFGVGVCAGIVW